jgi:hypothetical protein
MYRKRIVELLALFLAAAVPAACSDDGGNNVDYDAGPDANLYDVPKYQVSGTVYDFYAGEAIAGPAEISVKGILPAPQAEIDGAQFTVDGILPSSVINLVASSGAQYRKTYNESIEVVNADLSGVQAKVLSETYLEQLATAFGVTPVPGTSILLVKVVDQAGSPRAGIPANAFYVNSAAAPRGPYFLNENKQAAPGLTATDASGYAIFYDLPLNADSTLLITGATGGNYTMIMPVSPAGADAVTLAKVVVVDGDIQPPIDVSFENQIVQIFTARGCTYCHSGGGQGRQDANLSLQGSPALMHKELTEEISPIWGITRVNAQYPEQSLILTLPGPTPDNHPNTTFANVNDPDYQLILGWIVEGAQLN